MSHATGSEGNGGELVALRPRSAAARERTPPKDRPGFDKTYETVDSVLLTEPRIEAIRAELQALLKVVQLESGGKPIEVDGFRLRDPGMWAGYPSSLSEIFWHLSSVCNFSCEFCYEKGNPPGFPIQSLPRMATELEVETRLRHYDPASRRGLFTLRTAINEPFANRRAVDLLRRMRRKCPDELISFVTNGSYLTEDVIAALADLQPLFFNLSIYSTDPAVRRRVLVDRRPDRAVEAVRLLARYKIPYMTNLVMWPAIPFDDMERTIAYMAEHSAVLMRVCLGGYSRYLAGDFERFRSEDYWPRVVAEVERIRGRYPIPIVIEPSSYVRPDTDAVLDGVVAGSPAALAGLQRGDAIVAVNGVATRSRMQALTELRRGGRDPGTRPPGITATTTALGAPPRNQVVVIDVERDGARFSVELDRHDERAMATFPYRAIANYQDLVFGLVVTDCLRYSSLVAARRILERRRPRRTLLLTSAMIRPMLERMLAQAPAFAGFDVAIRVARNDYFGGTINVGDLLVVDDFITAIREASAQASEPFDLVLIPASPFASSPWGRDLTGRPWIDIERLTRIPVEQIPCPSITF